MRKFWRHRLTTLLLAAAVVSGFSACGSTDHESESGAPAEFVELDPQSLEVIETGSNAGIYRQAIGSDGDTLYATMLGPFGDSPSAGESGGSTFGLGKTSDGVNWETVYTSDERWAGALFHDGTLLVTEPSTSSVTIRSSSDAGATWQTQEVELPTSPTDTDSPLRNRSTIAANDTGIIIGITRGSEDFSADSVTDGLTSFDGGVTWELQNIESAQVFSGGEYVYAELDTGSQFVGPDYQLYRSLDLTTWEPVGDADKSTIVASDKQLAMELRNEGAASPDGSELLRPQPEVTVTDHRTGTTHRTDLTPIINQHWPNFDPARSWIELVGNVGPGGVVISLAIDPGVALDSSATTLIATSEDGIAWQYEVVDAARTEHVIVGETYATIGPWESTKVIRVSL